MKEWKYLIGSADDFIGASEEDLIIYRFKGGKVTYSAPKIGSEFAIGIEVIAERTESFGNAIDLEFCKANPNHPDCKCKNLFPTPESKRNGDALMSQAWEPAENKYSRPCKGVNIDIYDVLQSFAVTNPATQHAIKKLICAGLRGHKDKMQDLTEALKSIERAIELEKE